MTDTDQLRNSKDLERLRQEVKATWDKLSAEEKAALELKMRAAYNESLAARTASGGALEPAQTPIDIETPFQQRFRIPFAALRGEKVTAIHMNRAGEARNRICHRMNDVVSKRFSIAYPVRASS